MKKRINEQDEKEENNNYIIKDKSWFYKLHLSNAYVPIDLVDLKAYTYDSYINNLENKAFEISVRELSKKGRDFTVRGYWDNEDKLSTTTIGYIDNVKTHYFNVKKENYKIPFTKQISRIKYNHNTKKWIGVENESSTKDKNNLKTVQLPESWVYQNFDERIIEKLKNQNNVNKFLKVPVGDLINIIPTMDITMNPIIKYRNIEEGICAFASLASTFYFLHYEYYAQTIFELTGKNYEKKYPEFKKNDFNIITSIIAFIYKYEGFKLFRKCFTPNKLTKKCNIFEVER